MDNVDPIKESSLSGICRLVGTKGALAATGEVLKVENGNAIWKLDPAYAAWFWPLMSRVSSLVILINEKDLEPVEASDSKDIPEPPTETQKDMILRMMDLPENCARVYTLVLKGKPASVNKAFPTRTVNLDALRRCRTRATAAVG
jgi:hypothetical protein